MTSVGEFIWAAVARFDELANHGNLDGPHQIREKHEGVFEDGEHLDGFSFVVVGDLPAEFFDSLLNLIGGDYGTERLDSRTIHEVCVPPGTS